MDDNKLIAVILAILFPPAGVAVKEGGITDSFWINCILTLLGWFPGVLHALWVILR